MQQHLHLLVVDRDRRHGLAARYGSRWLLPFVGCTERTRAGPVVSRWLAHLGLTGSFVGQWVGRFAPAAAAMDWLVIVDARASDHAAVPSTLSWMPLEYLKSSPSLLEYQQWAFARAAAGELPVRPGPFGSLAWVDRVGAWLEQAAGPLDGAPLCYRATPHEVVLGFSAGSRRLYFKGLTDDRIAEAVLTQRLSVELPGAFAPTVALDRCDDGSVWWITEECGGTPLAGSTTEPVTTVAAALARTQCALADVAPTLHIAKTNLPAAAMWARTLLAARGDIAAGQRSATLLATTSESVHAADVPCSWTPLDIDPGNVLVDDGRVRFIDLDRSHVGPAPLAAATLLRRLRRAQPGSDAPAWIDAARHRYEQLWRPRFEFGSLWGDFEVASVLLECYEGWERLLRNIERGEVFGVLEAAAERTVQRLTRALTTVKR